MKILFLICIGFIASELTFASQTNAELSVPNSPILTNSVQTNFLALLQTNQLDAIQQQLQSVRTALSDYFQNERDEVTHEFTVSQDE
jgi:hypothetical protein